MPLRLEASAPDFDALFQRFAVTRRESPVDVRADVSAILEGVRMRGDEALCHYTQRFDRTPITASTLQISADEIAAARKQCRPDVLSALTLAAQRIARFHEAQKPKDIRLAEDNGIVSGARWGAIDAVGIYVPGGLASYPSSVLMNALPARVAGVSRIVMMTPTPEGRINPLVLAAADLAGVSEIYRVGGAQAIGALAYGTATIAPVDKIVGPGNAYVAEAKRQVYGVVGIDMIAGPSEILVVADNANNPAWIAADLLSQAEHDRTAQSILITDDAAFADDVMAALEIALPTLATQDIASQSWDRFGAVIVLKDLRDAPLLIDRLAPEHLTLAIAEPEQLFAQVRHAGSVFLGRRTPEAIGDYIGGPNHVLPTGRRARFSSGLSVADFMKRTTYLSCSEAGLAAIGPAAVALSEAEGLPAHGLSVSLRL